MRRSRTAPTALGSGATLSAGSLPAGLDQLPVDMAASFGSLPPLPLGGAASGLLPVGAPLGLAGLSAPLPGTNISASLIGGSAGAAAAAAMLAAADNAAAAAGMPGGAAAPAASDAGTAAATPTATPAVTPTAAAGTAFAAPFGGAALPQLPLAGAGLEMAGMGQPKRSMADADLDARFCQAVRLFGRDLKVSSCLPPLRWMASIFGRLLVFNMCVRDLKARRRHFAARCCVYHLQPESVPCCRTARPA